MTKKKKNGGINVEEKRKRESKENNYWTENQNSTQRKADTKQTGRHRDVEEE